MPIPIPGSRVPVTDFLLQQANSLQGHGAELLELFHLWACFNSAYTYYYFEELMAQGQDWREKDVATLTLQAAPSDAVREVLQVGAVQQIISRPPYWEGAVQKYEPIQGARGVINLFQTQLKGRAIVYPAHPARIAAGANAGSTASDVSQGAAEIVETIYAVRCNLFHGQKELANGANRDLLALCCPVVRAMIGAVIDWQQ